MTASWKTTALGILTIVQMVAGILIAILTGDIQTALALIGGGGITAGLEGIFARDNNVSSQEVGIRPPVTNDQSSHINDALR